MKIKRELGDRDKSPTKRKRAAEKCLTKPQKKLAETATDMPFTIEYILSKSGTDTPSRGTFFKSPFQIEGGTTEVTLDQYYTIGRGSASVEWEDMRTYKSFVLEKIKFKVGDYAYILPQSDSEDLPESATRSKKDHWVAHILEVRASDAQNVYALVAWMYWPGEHPTKKLSHYGDNEIIASNWLDVLNVCSFQGKVNVQQYLEPGFDTSLDMELFWRQTLNRKTQKLSPLPRFCVCNEHRNPDDSMLICTNNKCKTFLHEACIIHQCLQAQYDEMGLESPQKSPKKKSVKALADLPRPYENTLEGVIEDAEDSTPWISIKNKEVGGGSGWLKRVPCPKCGIDLEG